METTRATGLEAASPGPPPVSAHWRLFQSAATVGLLTILVKVAAAARVIVTARYFGASDDLDAFLIAFLIPSILVETAAATFTPAFVPALMRVRSTSYPNDPQQQALAQEAARKLAQSGTATMLAATIPLIICLPLFSPWLLRWLGSGFSPEKLHTTATLFWWLLLWLPFGACSATWRAILNSHHQVALAAALPLATPLISIALLSTAAHWGIAVLPAAVILGAAVEATVLAIAVRRLGYHVVPSWPVFRTTVLRLNMTPELRLAWGQYLPQLAGAGSLAVCGLIDQAVAGSLGSGSVSALSYGTRISSVMMAIGGTAIATAVLPEFSRLSAAGHFTALRRAVRLSALGTGLLMAIAAAIGIWFSTPLVRLIFQRGAFGSQDTEVVATIQRLAFLAVPIGGVLGIVQRLTAAVSSAALLIRSGLAALVVNIIGDLLLPRWFGVGGVAIASGLAQLAFLLALTSLLYAHEPRLFRASR